MAFVKFKTALNEHSVLLNVEHILVVSMYGDRVRVGLGGGINIDVAGTFDEVMRRLGDATDVYIDERAPDEAPA